LLEQYGDSQWAGDRVDQVGQGIITKVKKILSSGNTASAENPFDLRAMVANATILADTFEHDV
jgi:hypothetical protein